MPTPRFPRSESPPFPVQEGPTGLSEQDLLQILRETGYAPLERLIPSTGFAALFLLRTDEKGLEWRRFRDGRPVACLVQTQDRFTARLSLPHPTCSDTQIRVYFEESPRKSLRDCSARLVQTTNPSTTQAVLRIGPTYWTAQLDAMIQRLRKRFRKAAAHPTMPRHTEAAHDDSLPPEARKENWFRRVPQARL